MHCLKCGRETGQNQVFCAACLETMEAHPVKPGTAVNLPRHAAAAATKKSSQRKRHLTPDEQILYLRKHLRRARALGLILAVLLALSSAMLLYEIFNPDDPALGQNYTIDITPEAD